MTSAPDSAGPAPAGSRRRHARLRAGLLLAIGVLYLLSVPWYRDPDSPLRLFLGLPDWVAVALGCYIGAAVLNAWAWLVTDIDDARDIDGLLPAPPPDPNRPGARAAAAADEPTPERRP